MDLRFRQIECEKSEIRQTQDHKKSAVIYYPLAFRFLVVYYALNLFLRHLPTDRLGP